jgi:hypothetical protein
MLSVLDGEFGGAREALFFDVAHAWLVGLLAFGWACKRYPAMIGVMGIYGTAKLSWLH